MFNAYSLTGSPHQQFVADVLRPVVTTDRLRLSPSFNELFKASEYTLSGQGKIRFYGQPLAVKVVNHIEQPDAASVLQLIVHEVHRPRLIDPLRLCKRLRLFPDNAFLGLDAHVEFQFAVYSVHTLVVPSVSPDIAQMQKTQGETPVPLVVRQTN